MKTYRGCGLLPWLLVAMSLLLARPVRILAAESAPRQEAITLNAGETQVIDNLNPDSKPSIKVITNPHALVVHNEDPAKLVLLGAEEGKWAISAKLADGSDVVYNVSVHAIRDAANPLKPAEMPSASADDSKVASASSDSSSSSDSSGSSAGTVVKSATTEAEKIGDVASSVPAPSETRGEEIKMGEAPDTSAAASGPRGSSVIPSQTASAAIHAGKYTTDPGVVASGDAYSTEGVAFSGGTHYLPADGISLASGTSQIIDFPQRMHRVSIADTGVADVQVVNPFQLNLIAHKPGFTTLTVWTGQGHYEERQVRIDPNGKQQVLLNTVVAELNRGEIENQGVNLTAALPNYNVSLVGFPGAVATPYSGQASISSSGPQGSSSGQTLAPGGELLPLLLSQSMTYGLAAQNSNVLTQSFFQFLENHNLAKILAQPHLLANSGEKATFLSGGEIPIIVAQALNTSVVFKDFGTKVEFLPTVVGVNDIELLVKPEVSEPDFGHGVNLFGFQVPAFVTRRAETLVRLKDNQTLIVAGLILHEKKEQIDKVPYLGDIPYVRGLFRHTNWTDSESDLVMSVTPQIVRPLPTGGQVYLPTSHAPLTAEDISTHRLDVPDVGRPRF
jgi:Flp pilus assembly secretin CpaC